MGLIAGLLTLPLAPVRGTAWIAQQLLEQAERELDADEQLRQRLEALQIRLELGEIDAEEYEREEQELLGQFELRGPDSELADDIESHDREVVD